MITFGRSIGNSGGIRHEPPEGTIGQRPSHYLPRTHAVAASKSDNPRVKPDIGANKKHPQPINAPHGKSWIG